MAQQQFYDLYAKKMFLLCRRYVRNDILSEEIAMNGFLKFFSTLDQFEYKNQEATEGWLKRIMVNLCLKQLDKSMMMLISLEEAGDTPSGEDLLSQISVKEIYSMITQLPTGYRTIFNLFYMENMTHEQIAIILNISKNTSKSQLSRARQMLREILIKNNKEYESRGNQ